MSVVRPEEGGNNYQLLSVYLHERCLTILQSSVKRHCDPCYRRVCVCVCLGQGVGVCIRWFSASPGRQMGDCPVVLADCARDEACSFLTVSLEGSEGSCDFYAWTSDNIACTSSGQVSDGSHMAVLSLVHPASDTP